MQTITSMSCINLAELSQEEKRELFIRRAGWTLSYLAKNVGVSTATLSRHLRNTRMPSEQHRALVDLGMPPELLPEPRDIKPGPKPKLSSVV